MDQISKVLFVISNSLLIPDILFLIILFIRSLILVGGFYNSFMQRRRMNALLGDVHTLNAGNLSELSGRLPKSNRSPFIDHLDDLLTREGLTLRTMRTTSSAATRMSARRISPSLSS